MSGGWTRAKGGRRQCDNLKHPMKSQLKSVNVVDIPAQFKFNIFDFKSWKISDFL